MAQRDKDRKAELAQQDRVEIAVADRNSQITKGANPDPNVGVLYEADGTPIAQKGKGK